jgi:5-methylcytosine-specific restriction endonuclease McrA
MTQNPIDKKPSLPDNHKTLCEACNKNPSEWVYKTVFMERKKHFCKDCFKKRTPTG